ncbi:hypothetical protein PIB30_003933 [Stylosanthes scabra]|uniref:Uncharacterized protein n=1 Tax=Stylosanthes scabra TaxID=79078 RepID=A0ABU6V4W9_9FABA|nr:hypothetical protein [Stylosanthes scabra]
MGGRMQEYGSQLITSQALNKTSHNQGQRLQAQSYNEIVICKVLKIGSVIEPFKLPVRSFIGSTDPIGGTTVQNPKPPILENFHLGDRTGRSDRPVSCRFTGSIPAFSRTVSACRSIRFHDRATVEPVRPCGPNRFSEPWLFVKERWEKLKGEAGRATPPC